MPSSLHTSRYQVFRKLLIAARERSGLTQVQIAAQLGKPQSYISKYERGERRLDFPEFLALSEVMGIDVIEFLNAFKSATSSASKPDANNNR